MSGAALVAAPGARAGQLQATKPSRVASGTQGPREAAKGWAGRRKPLDRSVVVRPLKGGRFGGEGTFWGRRAPAKPEVREIPPANRQPANAYRRSATARTRWPTVRPCAAGGSSAAISG